MKVHFWAVFDWASKVILVYFGFLVLTLLCGWLVKLALLSHPMRSKANSDFYTRIFLRLLPATCNCFKFWLAHCFLYIDYDGSSICFGFGFTMLGWSNNFLKKFFIPVCCFAHSRVQSHESLFPSIPEDMAGTNIRDFDYGTGYFWHKDRQVCT